MKAKAIKIATFAMILMYPGLSNAQFNTIKKKEACGYEIITAKGKEIFTTENQIVDTVIQFKPDIEDISSETTPVAHKISEKDGVRKKHLGFTKVNNELPELTINNLLKEIRINGIQHEKIVLAQAILETGWFTSSVCRNKNNLFGLTNPKTGNYYEFNHWTESVRAYYTKVQYRYKGGNYLLWLDRIGYAEDPRYVSSLIRILRQYM